MSAIQHREFFLIVTILYSLSDLLDCRGRRIMAFKIENNLGDNPDAARWQPNCHRVYFIRGRSIILITDAGKKAVENPDGYCPVLAVLEIGYRIPFALACHRPDFAVVGDKLPKLGMFLAHPVQHLGQVDIIRLALAMMLN